MKIKRKTIQEINLKYVNCYLIQNWWDGAEISYQGSEFQEVEENGSNLPMLIPINESITNCKSLKDCKVFQLKIDLDNGHIENWPKGYAMNIYWKICDQGVYEYIDENGNIIEKLDCDYVPDYLAIEDDGYGDYVIINIDENGNIKNWWSEHQLKSSLEEIFDNIFEIKNER